MIEPEPRVAAETALPWAIFFVPVGDRGKQLKTENGEWKIVEEAGFSVEKMIFSTEVLFVQREYKVVESENSGFSRENLMLQRESE